MQQVGWRRRREHANAVAVSPICPVTQILAVGEIAVHVAVSVHIESVSVPLAPT